MSRGGHCRDEGPRIDRTQGEWGLRGCVLVMVLMVFLLGCDGRPQLALKVSSSSMSPTFSPGTIVETEPFNPRWQTLHRFDVVAFRPHFRTGEVFLFRVVGLPGEAVTISTNGLLIDERCLREPELPRLFAGQSWIPRQEPWIDSPVRGTNLTWNLTGDQIFVVGDNLSNAYDSRYWGPLQLSNVIATARKAQ